MSRWVAKSAGLLLAGWLGVLIGAVPVVMIGNGVRADPLTAGAGPFSKLPGRWVGEGRLGFKDGKVEAVTCRATYFTSDSEDALKQTIRCASPSGKIEVKSALSEQNGVLSGRWTEEIYNLSGDLTGEITPLGLKVVVKGQDLDANMDLIVKGNQQVVEIQFHNTSLIGITLILKRSDSAGGES